MLPILTYLFNSGEIKNNKQGKYNTFKTPSITNGKANYATYYE